MDRVDASRPASRAHPLARVARVIVRFGKAHRRLLVKGCAAALFTVAARLSMPWPAHALMHFWKMGEDARARAVTHEIPGLDWSLTLGVTFLALMVALGLGDAILRVQFAKFSIGTIRDMRSAAVQAALSAAGGKTARPGDLVARLVGDTARVKAGLKGFLVHVAPNGVLYLGVTVILFCLNVRLGLVFGAAGLGTTMVTLLGARAMYRTSKRYRRKEGRLADEIDQAIRLGSSGQAFAATNRSSGSSEAALTRIQSLTTWSTYVMFGLAIVGAVWIGTREIAAGVLEPRDMVLFLMYALIIRGPTVRLARQGARLGKTVASANRVVNVLDRAPREITDARSAPVPNEAQPKRGVAMTSPSRIRVLFTGYAPVQYLCFRPLHERLRGLDHVDVHVSGGLETKTRPKRGVTHDEKAMYGPLGLPSHEVLGVDEIRERDYDFLFVGNTTLIRPRSVGTTIQIFHGVSFRNRAIRPANMACDYYFLVGPYMARRFAESGLLPPGDPRAVEVGFMKTDRLVDGSLDRRVLLTTAGFDGSRPVLLYAPTGQKRNSLETVGEEVLERLVGSGRFDVLLKLHDHPKNVINWRTRLSRLQGPRFRISDEPDVIKLLAAADLLVTDASSVSSEFSLLDRPMIFLDVPELLANAEGKQDSMLDLDTWGRKGGVIVGEPSAIVDAVAESLSRPDTHAGIRHAMAADLFFNPGHATDRAFAWFRSVIAERQVS